MTKEVRFDIYCKQCQFANASPSNDPCNDCLGDPSNEGSHVPKYFKKAKSFINFLLPDPNVLSSILKKMKKVIGTKRRRFNVSKTNKGVELVVLGSIDTKDEGLLDLLKENGFYLLNKKLEKFDRDYYTILSPKEE